MKVRGGAKRIGASVVASALVAGGLVVSGEPVRAQEAGITETAQAPTRTFNIPPQSLASALPLFGQQSGRQITSDGNAVQGASTSGVQGTMTVDEALRRLLAGTGMTYSVGAGSIISVQRVGPTTSNALQLDPVQVQGVASPPQAEIGNLPPPYAGGNVARGGRVGELGNRDYMDTPFSTTTYTEKYLERNQARTVVDAVVDDPTIRPLYGQGQYDDRLQIRGFFASVADMSFNGLYGVAPIFAIDLAGIERMEVFRGPSALLSGMAPQGAIGGTINFAPKRATSTPITRVTARYASDAQFGGNLDFGRRFGPDDSSGLRLNAAFMGGQTSVSNNSDALLNLTAGFDYKGDRIRFDADLGYINRNITGVQGGSFLAAGLLVPPAPNARNNFYQPWSFYSTNETYGMLRVEYDITNDITAYAKLGGRSSNGAFLTDFPFIFDTSGNMSSGPGVTRNITQSGSGDAGIRARFGTGAFKHEAVINGSILSTTNYGRYNGLPAVASNIYVPVTGATPNLTPLPTNIPLTSQQVLSGVGVIDAISVMDEKLQLIGGLRYQTVQVSNWNGATGLSTPGYNQNAWTPSASLIVRPWKEVSFYGNFIQALEQGPIAAPGLTNANQVFSPFVSTQFEVGAKVDLGKFGATLSAFQITRPSSFVNATTNSLVVDGQQRNSGIEFTMFGEPVPGLRPIGGFSILNAVQTNTLNGINNGKYAPGVPTFQANLGLDWDMPWVKGLAVGGRVIYTGSSYLDAENLQQVPAWVRFDLSASYTFERPDGKPIALRGQVLNIGDNNYWMATGGYLTQGQPRTFMLSLTADF